MQNKITPSDPPTHDPGNLSDPRHPPAGIYGIFPVLPCGIHPEEFFLRKLGDILLSGDGKQFRGYMVKVEIKPVDARGRIILPMAWRKRLKTNSVVVIHEDDRLEIRPADADLSRFVDSVEVGAEHFGDYHKLRKGLRRDAVH